jgi:coenzyme F420-reducing hydrogenase delta subunit
MATFEYEAVMKSETGEEHFERGCLVASSRTAAEQKLKELQLEPRRLHQITGLKGLLKSLTADIK